LVNGVVSLTVRVCGSGDYLSVHAGNLDIINCAALEIAKQWVHVDRSSGCRQNEYNKVIDI
jgi:acetaldehyde dehydrogenase